MKYTAQITIKRIGSFVSHAAFPPLPKTMYCALFYALEPVQQPCAA